MNEKCLRHVAKLFFMRIGSFRETAKALPMHFEPFSMLRKHFSSVYVLSQHGEGIFHA